LVEDALYAMGSHIRQIQKHQWDFIIGVKADGNAKLFEHFEARRRQGAVKKMESKADKNGISLHCEWANNLPLNESNGDIRVNMLHCHQIDAKGRQTSFSWGTSIVDNSILS